MTSTDILYEKKDGVAWITINRPEVRNAFRTKTVAELTDAFVDARWDPSIGVVVLTGAGDKAFCAGGDQKERGQGGYAKDQRPMDVEALHSAIRHIPKPVIAMVNGFAIGGGHVLHVLCDLSIAADTAVFGQTGPRVGSVDAGHGTGYLARVVGEKKAREIWYLCRQYSAQEALAMGLVNTVGPASSPGRSCAPSPKNRAACSSASARRSRGCTATSPATRSTACTGRRARSWCASTRRRAASPPTKSPRSRTSSIPPPPKSADANVTRGRCQRARRPRVVAALSRH